MPADVRPYLVPASDTAAYGPWQLWDAVDWTPLPDAVEGWDPGTDLHVRREVRVDVDRLRAETGLGAGCDLALTVSWSSSTSGMTESAAPVMVVPSGGLMVEALLRGTRIGGVVRLRTTLSVVALPPVSSPGVAWMPGSILSDDVHMLALEGSLSMFPVHEVDFSHTRLSPEASWHLETSTDLTAPFLGAFRLLLNSRDKELMAAVARGVKDKRQQALWEELQHGVAMAMLELAVLLGEELADRDPWPPETVGDVLSRMLAAGQQDGEMRMPSGPHDAADFRTRLAGATRYLGHGRAFR